MYINLWKLIIKKKSAVLFFGCMAAVTAFLLVTFEPSGSSWLFYNESAPQGSWWYYFGSIGAGTLLFFFGKASWLLAAFFTWIAYAIASSEDPIEPERFVAWLALLLSGSCLFVLFDPHGVHCGLIGILCNPLYQWLGYTVSLLFIFSVQLISLIIISQLNLVIYAKPSLRVLRRSKSLAHAYIKTRAAALCLSMLKLLAFFVVRVLKRIAYFVYRIVDGTLLYEAGFMLPEPNESQASNADVFHIKTKTTIQPLLRTVNTDKQPQVEKPAQRIFLRESAKKTAQRENALPDLSFLDKDEMHGYTNEDSQQRAVVLQEKLERFGIKGTVASIKPGPVVTLFEYAPEMDIKLSKITALEDDLALALRAKSIRILAPIPGTSVVGFEVANNNRDTVLFGQIIRSSMFKTSNARLPLILGKDTKGDHKVVDLVTMPHLLVAGSTGSGKSVGLSTMLMSLICAKTPRELRLILIDPKRLEFSSFQDIGHLLFPIVNSAKQAAPVLRWVVKEMEERYEKMAQTDARNIFDYNDQVDQENSMPYIVVVIDELADLMMTAGKEIEDLITRIAQMARAAGIHMIVATQRPSVDVITGLIKVNFPSRISFRVTSKIDSRTILDSAGAEKLLGCGDMLFLHASASELQRIHGAYISSKEIATIVHEVQRLWPRDYKDLTAEIASVASQEETEDVLYREILSYLDEVDEVSISLLQRKFRIGYNRSARMIDILESKGLILPAQGGRTRKVIKHG